MSPLTEFLEVLFCHGRAVVRARPALDAVKDEKAGCFLQKVFGDYRLEVAGPLIDFDAEAAVWAGAILHRACWFLVSRDEPDSVMQQALAPARKPRSPAEHLSADLVLRFLPQVQRRAKAVNPSDQLPVLLTEILRRWPLSGVLADVEEEPLTPLDFGGHSGLLMLYAERLAQHERAQWLPGGAGLEYFDIVREEPSRNTETADE